VLHPILWWYHQNRGSNYVPYENEIKLNGNDFGFASGCRKVLKTKRSFRKSLSLAETERNVQFKLVCAKRRSISVCSLYETVMSMRKLMGRRMKMKHSLHSNVSWLSNYLSWAGVSFYLNMPKINLQNV
jgi:hypothetical protein